MNNKEVDEWLRRKAREAVDKWFKEQSENPYESFHLYYRQGEIVIAPVWPTMYSLAHPQRISPAWTGPQAERFIIEIMRKLPGLLIES